MHTCKFRISALIAWAHNATQKPFLDVWTGWACGAGAIKVGLGLYGAEVWPGRACGSLLQPMYGKCLKNKNKKYAMSMVYVKSFHFILVSCLFHTLFLLWASKGSLAPWGGLGQGPRAPLEGPSPPQGAKDPLEAQSTNKVCCEYDKKIK